MESVAYHDRHRMPASTAASVHAAPSPFSLRRLLVPLVLLLFAHFTPAAADEGRNALVLVAQSNPQQLLEDARQSLAQARDENNKAGELRALQGMSMAHRFLFALDDLKDDTDKGIVLARELHDSEALCWFLSGRALSMYGRGSEEADGMLREVNGMFDEAIGLANKHGLQSCLPWVHISRGKIYNAVRRTSDSLASASRAYDVFEANRDRIGMAAALTDMAAYTLIRNSMADSEKINDYLDRAARLFDPLDFPILAAENNLLRGHNQYFRNNRALARQSFAQAANIARGAHYAALLGVAERELAELDKADGRYAQALGHVDQSLPLVAKHPDSRHHIKALLLKAEILAKMGKTADSQAVLALARVTLEKTNDASSAVLFYSRAAELEAGFGRYQEAYQELESLRKVNDWLAALRNQRLGDELKVRFDVALTESENARLLAEREKAESKRLALTLGLTLTMVLSAVLLGGLGLYFRKRSADIQREIAHQKRVAAAEAAANHAKSEFLANMSHELRSPLNAILGFSRLASRESGLSSEAKSNLQIVVKSGEHLYQLINQILDLSKIEAGRMVLHDTVFDLHALLNEIEKMFSLVARQKNLRLTIDRAPDMPVYVRADASKLRQILINLLSNALKFTSEGSVVLRVGRGLPGRLTFVVTDTGPGIEEAEISTLGTAFVQAQAGRRSREGTGLGLAISNRFVQLMDGDLKLSSTPGAGSSFSFDIAAAEIDDPEALIHGAWTDAHVVGLVPGQPRFRILAVDDLSDQRRLLVQLLAPLGFEIREASNGAEAVDIWKEWSPHLIWMDMRMPILNGREATKRIRATEKGKSTIIIALTASSFEDERDAIIAAGCDDFMRKPFQEHVLFEHLRRYLGVQFIYDQPSESEDVLPIDAARLASLPAALLERFATALAGLDVDMVESTIQDIRMIDAGIADSLGVLAATFDYGQILAHMPAPSVRSGASDTTVTPAMHDTPTPT